MPLALEEPLVAVPGLRASRFYWEVTPHMGDGLRSYRIRYPNKKDDRFRVFKEGNVLSITTIKPASKDFISEVKLVQGTLANQK